MKNLTKIFFAVVAGMFAFSCVTDTTEDLGVKLEGQGGVYEVAVSLEATKTQLGEKVDGLYPLYWSEGDAIAINGVVSNPLTAGGSADATFQFNEEVYRPYCVVYPASAAVAAEDEVVEEPAAPVTVYPVTFAATQPYTVGTFAPGVAPMYGYAAELAEDEVESAIELNHLTGVLRLAIKGNGEKVTGIVVKTQKGKIAGPFTVDCANGALTALEGAANTVNVTFADGLVLGAEATPVYVTVPAGSYGTFVITVNTENNGKMTVKFDSDAKAINAGSVREFKEFAYEVNANDTEEIFLIDSEEALIEFARIAATFYPRTEAKVVANLDLTGVEWTPIKNFGEFVFDGGSDEGYTINGLTAPLFENTAATIKNVKLTNVNMTVTDRVHSGAIACNLYGAMDNCSAEGTINLNNTTFAPEKITNQYEEVCHGGLVGVANGATVTNCVNDIDITITSLTASTVKIKSTVGGIVGGACAAAKFQYLTNNGDITYVGTTQGQNVYISGVVGKTNTQFGNVPVAAMNDCTNNGALSSAPGSVCAGSILLSGITGNLQMETEDILVQNLLNTGAITHAGKSGGLSMAGGVCYLVDAKMYNWKNTGAITVKAGAESKDANVAGLVTGDIHATSVDLCVNTGNVVVEKSTLANVKLGGVSSDVYYATHITNCSNSGNISVASETTATSIYIGGISAQSVATQEITNCTNSGAFSVGDKITCSDYIQVLGLFCTISMRDGISPVVTGLKNTGNLSVGAVTTTSTGNSGRIYMGGIVGTVNAGSYSQCSNEGNITVGAATLSKEFMIGGFAGYVNYTNALVDQVISFTDCENTGDITLTPAKVGGSYVGGFAGQAWAEKTDQTVKFTRVKNSGSITCGGEAWGTPYIAGIFAQPNNYAVVELDGCENSGDISFSAKTASPYIGGIVCHATNKKSVLIKNCTNKGNISNSTVVGSTRMGGILGSRESSGSMSIEGCTNLGTVALSGEQTATGNSYAIGGIVGYTKTTATTIKNCINGSATDTTKGTVTAGAAPGGIGIAGIAGLINFDVNIEGCKNYGHISQTGKGSSGSARTGVGGVAGISLLGNCLMDKCENFGTVEYGTAAPGGKLDVGGVIAHIIKKGTVSNCKNSATVIFGATTSAETNVGGVVGFPEGQSQVINCENTATGVVWAKGKCSSNYNVGGIIGSTNSNSDIVRYCANYGLVQQTATNNGQNYIGGIVGYAYTWSEITHCTNAGPIETVGTSSSKRDYVGGIIGYGRHMSGTSLVSDCVNTYPLVFTGKAGYIRHGGIFGCTTNEKPDAACTLKNLYNLADLTFKGKSTAAAGTAEALCCGGITGLSRTVIDNGQHYGDIKAIGLQGYVGAIYGVPYTIAAAADTYYHAINSKAGGNIIYGETQEPDASGDVVTVEDKTPIDLTMLYSAAIDASIAEEDGCSILTAKPAVPVYTYNAQ